MAKRTQQPFDAVARGDGDRRGEDGLHAACRTRDAEQRTVPVRPMTPMSGFGRLNRATRGITAISMNGWFGNKLLDALPAETLSALSPHLTRAYVHRGQQLSRPERPLGHFVFPIDALLWDWAPSAEGESVISLFESGSRGAAAGAAWLKPRAGGYVTALLPGTAWILSEEAAEATQNDPAFWSLTNRWLYDRFNVTAHRLVCAAEHNLDRRLARALLWIMDETGRPEIALTHREISIMTAIRRPSVSLTLADFQKHGIVRLHHGLVQVMDRRGLERQCCSCYRVIRSLVEAPRTSDRRNVSTAQIGPSGVEPPIAWETTESPALATFDGSFN